jgi:hypothetical protein
VKFEELSDEYNVWFSREFLDEHLEDFNELEDNFDELEDDFDTVPFIFTIQFTFFT